ncbi:MAG TPA: class I SAM-dependent methyltransferase [Bacteroidota bacterium]|nr:class I SAM-dependent methyltransferase [Bacteroidota bacterium]
MSLHDHWESLYTSKPANRLGWYRPHLDTSVQLIESLHLPPDAPIIDVGCGVSSLADDLLSRGFGSLTLLDISESALQTLRRRLPVEAQGLRFLAADVLSARFAPGEFMLWHDRAVFHFLTAEADRRRYVEQVSRALRRGGYLIMGVFSLEAPPTCSGLPVQRYDAEQLRQVLAPKFSLLQHCSELHITPGGTRQNYLYAVFQRLARD